MSFECIVYMPSGNENSRTPGVSTPAHMPHAFPGDEEFVCDNTPLPSSPSEPPPDTYDTRSNVAPSSEHALEHNRNMEEEGSDFAEWTGFGDDIEMNDTPRGATNMSQDPPMKTKRSRGRPSGSKCKVKKKARQQVINTRILRSQASSATHGKVAKHDYDVVEVTVSPRKVVARPTPSQMHEVSLTPVQLVAGPSMSIEAPPKSTPPSPSLDEVYMLTRLTNTIKCLAKGCKDGDDGMDVQA